MRFRFLWVGQTRDREARALERRYLERLRHYFPVELTVIRETRKTDPHQETMQSRREAEAIKRKIAPGAFLVALDEQGDRLDSPGLAAWLADQMRRGVPELVFVVGGFAGLPGETKRSAGRMLSLSSFTLPHELARVVLTEQVYRAVTILKGLPYHK